jgi:hypothetical protein
MTPDEEEVVLKIVVVVVLILGAVLATYLNSGDTMPQWPGPPW